MSIAVITYDCGPDQHGRKVTLKRTTTSTTPGPVWTISRAPANQRDDAPTIHDVPEAVMRRLARAVLDPLDQHMERRADEPA